MPTYAVLLPADEATWDAATSEQRAEGYAAHDAFGKALAERGHQVVGGAELSHSRRARHVRVVEGRTVVTAGPYAESVEQLTGFYVVRSDDVDDLLEVCAMLAEPGGGAGGVEVRETVEAPGSA